MGIEVAGQAVRSNLFPLWERDEEGEELDATFICENRMGLHKRIIRAILQNIEEKNVDNSMVGDEDIDYAVEL